MAERKNWEGPTANFCSPLSEYARAFKRCLASTAFAGDVGGSTTPSCALQFLLSQRAYRVRSERRNAGFSSSRKRGEQSAGLSAARSYSISSIADSGCFGAGQARRACETSVASRSRFL